MKIVPDTSVIVDGRLSQLIESGEYERAKVVIPEAAIDEIENMANQGRASGFAALDELKKLQEMSRKGLVKVDYYGERPSSLEFGKIDALIREAAQKLEALLLTADRVQASVAEAKGIKVELLRPLMETREKPRIYNYFDEHTMSIHLKEKVIPMAKKGTPGEFKLVKIADQPVSEKEISSLAKEIVEFARQDRDSFIEIEREGSTVVQLRQIRIAIARPPFSDGYEITAVRAVAEVTLEDYRLSQKLIERLKDEAEGILVAGPPGAGKTTFSQALAEFYKDSGKIIKTMESPRDLLVSEEITQYSPLEGDMAKTADILLLVRPDYTIYDEVRKTRDFSIFSDMRLAGVGMVGVTHATKALDAVQRMIGRVELGMIPQIVDTIIFIKDGELKKVYNIKLTVKVPAGLLEADLARPVIEVRDFETDTVEYEIYTFGEETVVMPAEGVEKQMTPVEKLAREKIVGEIKKKIPGGAFEVEIKDNSCLLWVEERYIPQLIGKKGKNIEKMEKKLGIKIDVRSLEEREESGGEKLGVKVEETKKYFILSFNKMHSGKMVEIYTDETFLFTGTVSRQGEIKISRKSEMGEVVASLLRSGEELYALEA